MKLTLKALWSLPLLLAACGGGTPSVADAEAALCGAIDDFGSSLAAYGQLTADSTVDELQTAREDVVSSYEAMKTAANTVQDARIVGVETAYADLQRTVDGISGRDTLGEAATQVSESLATVQTAREQLYSDLSCP
ncbi:hypothetical protein [Leptolyngbya iicbica]|uniref:Lipoprotein n=2 Tax=Cyanophyceae TaxID=3028117 RepID=A0A4Q7E286_9CYAN|nr:hypothetical protein [Leptolyngbya sp. LK]RZM75645.1 hypothetical protein DYY88_20290 [Leptolyngbya sp. LK]